MHSPDTLPFCVANFRTHTQPQRKYDILMYKYECAAFVQWLLAWLYTYFPLDFARCQSACNRAASIGNSVVSTFVGSPCIFVNSEFNTSFCGPLCTPVCWNCSLHLIGQSELCVEMGSISLRPQHVLYRRAYENTIAEVQCIKRYYFKYI